MARVTIRIIDGAGRGKCFESLLLPVTIGREEGNTIQVDDDRVSRYHLKIQEDHDKLVLTDLESTNGTRVNGEDTQLRILRCGDLITVGRSVLLIGSRDEIADRLASLRENDPGRTQDADVQYGTAELSDIDEFRDQLAEELNWIDDPDNEVPRTLHLLTAPELPERLSPGQAAQVSELVEFFHIRLRRILAQGIPAGSSMINLPQKAWQDLVDLQSQSAEYLRRIGEP